MTESKAQREEIAIVGIGCRFPDAKGYISFWHNLSEGKNSVQDIISRTMVIDGKEYTVGRWDEKFYSPDVEKPNTSNSRWCGLIDRIDEFDNQFFNISPREAKNMDPQQRLLLQETWHCIEDSGVPLYDLRKKKTGVLIGVMASDYHQEISKEEILIDSYAGLGNYNCILANRISYHFGFTGISMATDAACASSLVAIHQGRNSLLNHESDYILAGGVALNSHPWKYISFSKSRMLSPDGQCKTFDKSANGYVPGEGVAVVLMQRLSDAIASGNHIYGIVKGSHVNHCGVSRSITAPSIKAQEELIKHTFDAAQVRPNSISYVEAHGTGTSLGDPIEIEALSNAYRNYIPTLIDKDEFEREIISWIESGKTRDFVKDCFQELPDQRRKLKILSSEKTRKLEGVLKDIKYINNKKQFCKIGSLKTNIGHLEACAGIAGVIKVLMMMKYRKIPPTLNLTTPNPIINWDTTPFTIAGFSKGIAKLVTHIKNSFKIQNISPTLFNAKSVETLSHCLLESHRKEVETYFAESEDLTESLRGFLRECACEFLALEKQKLHDQTDLYKKSEPWYPPEINLLVQLLKFKYRMTVINDEIIHSLSIDDIADLLVSIQKETLEEYYADGETVPDYKLVQLVIKDLVYAVAEIFMIPISEVDISKNIGTFQKTPLRAAVSSFGFGGVNSHVILEEYPQIYKDKDTEAPFNLFLLSAKTEQSFAEMKESWLRYKESSAFAKFSIRDICSNVMVGREHFPYRFGFIFDSKKRFPHIISSAVPAQRDNKKLIAMRVSSILWNGFANLTRFYKEVPLLKKRLKKINSLLKELNIYKSVRDGILQNSWSPKYKSLYSFLVNVALIETIKEMGLKIDLYIPEKDGALLTLVLSGMISLKDVVLLFEKQIFTEQITITTPQVPIIDPMKGETVSPFLFTKEYLEKLISGLSQADSDLNDLFFSTNIESQSEDSSVRLATIFKKRNIITDEEMHEYLRIHNETGFSIDEIVCQKNRRVTQEEIAGALQENELLSYYVDDIMHMDKARQLNENQYTFKGYIDEWDRKLRTSHKMQISHLLDIKSNHSVQTGHSREKELLLILISASLRKLNNRWNLQSQQKTLRPEFNEIIDLLTAGVMTQEHIISLLLDEDPPMAKICRELNAAQFKCDPTKEYPLIYQESRKHLSLNRHYSIDDWIAYINSEGASYQELLDKKIAVIDKQISDFHVIHYGQPTHETVAEPHIQGRHLFEDELKETLLHFWSLGYKIKWHTIIQEGTYNRLALPLYRFEKRSFWIHGEKFNNDFEEGIKNSGILHRFIKEKESPNVANEQLYLLQPHWTPRDIGQLNEERRVIQVGTVTLPFANKFIPQGKSAEELEALLTQNQDSFTILIYWHGNETKVLQEELPLLIGSLQYIFTKASQRCKGIILYNRTDQKRIPIFAPIAMGLFKTLKNEHDLPIKLLTADRDLSLAELHNELSEMNWNSEVNYKGAIREIRGEDTIVPETKKLLLDEKSVVIIAGGSGKLGVLLAQTLLNEYHCTVVSLGRKETSVAVEELMVKYRGESGSFSHYQWTPHDPSSVKKLIKTISETHGSIRGVCNCAGLVSDALFLNKEVKEYQQVVSAKLTSTLALHMATYDQPLQFFALFSSIVSDTGNVGQSDYASANCFLNAFAHYRNSKNFPGNTVAIKWSLWKEGGMGLDLAALRNFSSEENRANPGIIRNPEAMRTVLTLFTIPGEVSVVTNENYRVIKEKSSPSPELVLENTRSFVTSLIAEKSNICVDTLPLDEPFFSLGISSLATHEITAALQKRYKAITPTLLFEYPNTNALITFLESQEKTEQPNFSLENNPMIPSKRVPKNESELLQLLKELENGTISLEEASKLTEQYNG